MNTPTDTPAAPAGWAEWKAKALELADAIASAQVNDDRDHGLAAARAALAAHLDSLPMGPPVVWLRECAELKVSAAQRVHATQADANDVAQMYRDDGYECSVSPLYRHPKESA